MKNQKKLVLGLVLVLVVVIFALLNTSPAAINFGITTIKVPLILLIVLLLLIGALVAFLMGRDQHVEISEKDLKDKLAKQKKELEEKAEKEIAKLQAEIKTLKSESIDDSKKVEEEPQSLPEPTTEKETKED